VLALATLSGFVVISCDDDGKSTPSSDADITGSETSSCGNGIVDIGEQCDDGNTQSGDGCEANCLTAVCDDNGICDAAETQESCPTDCPTAPDLGSFACNDTINTTTTSVALAADAIETYTITFTNDVALSGSLTVNSTGDLDFAIEDSTGSEVFSSSEAGDEAWDGVAIGAGTYTLLVQAYTDATTGYVLSLTVECVVCGDGALSGDEQCDDGNTAPTVDGCSAGCKVDFGYACTTAQPSVCTMIPSLGSFACGDAIADKVRTTAMAADDFDQLLLTFSTDVILSGSVTAGSTGDLDFYVVDTGGNPVFDASNPGDETFANKTLAAGTYLLAVVAFEEAATGYALALSGACNVCGDGVVVGAEDCDDGNAVAGDGCESDCTLSAGFCFADADYAAATLSDQGATMYADGAEIFAALNTDTDVLYLEAYNGYGAFATHDFGPGTYTIAGDELSPIDCGLCVYLYTDASDYPSSFVGTPAGDYGYFATGGTLTITSVLPNIVATVSNLTFEHIAADANGDPIAAADGCTSAIASASIDALVQ